MDHASSHYDVGPLFDDSYHVLVDISPSQYDVGPPSNITGKMIGAIEIDDSYSLILAIVPS